ncbi:MAG: coniferyl aldehyde dehydrogenase [Halieaceae bacterium]|jgi:coniferyl-aldehyde dehydrogenase|nr:coniferyl aldehyde dehydrogenase [Halieaceae bacterium]
MNQSVTLDPASAANLDALRAPLNQCFEQQRAAYLADTYPSLEQRRHDLEQLRRLIAENRDAIVAAISEDYGNRSAFESKFAEIITAADTIAHTLKHLKRWMKPQKRAIDWTMYFGASNRVIPQPLGVVGLIVPWNFPINLAFSQLAAVFAAGNRAMVKMSENSRHLTRLLIELSPRYLPQDKLCFFEETGGVGIEFSQLPFDLMIFTGSGATGRKVMSAAAQNLTPVILELGGKAPAVIDPNYPLAKAVERIMFVKQFNAGQICTNVDYVFVHESQREAFVQLAKDYAAKHCPDILSSDYTSVIDERAFDRLLATIEDAQQKGATVLPLSEQAPDRASRKIPMHLVLDTTPDMTIRQRETFGPLLMVLTYQHPDEVVDYVNQHDRPLALYPFSNDKELVERYIRDIMSGGVTVNDALFHVAQHDLPFGGVGPSGMGHYHGYDGFVACSKMRPVFYQASTTAMKWLAPPYGKFANRVIDLMMKMKV